VSQSESAKANSAAQTRMRIEAPNSRPRTIKAFPLDAGASAQLVELAERHPRLMVVDWMAGRPEPAAGRTLADWFGDMAGWTRRAVDAIAGADVVVIVATAPDNGELAGAIGDACRERGKLPLSIVLRGAVLSDDDLSALLRHLRPHSGMLVIADDPDYVDAMVSALRA
jgi:hypothetical protein